ncbi:thioesterase II family protein [Bradyrhizobium yuanmingense]|uniref:Surfactin synthase thioesterase subunit n=1 Tax=Bradyrhizobium yuanmingense TaxID=108015 RepID=A0A1C3XID5_9BRAD|nr:alpha/beta fold hydrolase [Bradyrhizobium yuanmingense]TWI17258.1 surfactin synthase thioesterase subunit [Bradyrhizobium yuanmingense]SCB52018.1 Surfactin synthase thioesterase subunit [Bradyrhizobium yuanmingense]
MKSPAGPWLPLGGASEAGRLSLFCFHHAGGGASAFTEWRRLMPREIDVLPVQLPGREERIDEPACRSMPALTAELLKAMAPCLDRPFALFGHSFGAAVAFELTRQLRRKPSHLFVSSWVPMDASARAVRPTRLSDRDFIARIVHYGGLPEAVANDREMMSVLIKSMRADVEILETYRPEAPVRLACPTTLLGGEDDPVVRPELLERWASHVHASVPVLLPGGHFYFRRSLPVLIDLVVSTLRPVLRAMPC